MGESPDGRAKRLARNKARNQRLYALNGPRPKTAKQLETTRLYNRWVYAYSFYTQWYDKEVINND